MDTPGGRYYGELDLDAPVTREGQLIFFAQFLHTGGRWARLLEGCPLRYYGNRGSGACNVVGTAARSILCGHWRYAHINALRGDTLNPPHFLLHGDQDPQMPVEQAHELDAAYKKAGLRVQLEILRGAGHGGAIFYDAERLGFVKRFLEQNFR